MQSLQDYLNNTKQCESILNPNQDQVVNRMTKAAIRKRISDHITIDDDHYILDSWIETDKIDQDSQGWYVDSLCIVDICEVVGLCHENEKSFYDCCVSHNLKMDKQKGCYIEDMDLYFRWRRHKGGLLVQGAPNLESTDGFPAELDLLCLEECCANSKKFEVRNNIDVISLKNIKNLKIIGKGCKNVIISPDGTTGKITAPSGVKIHHPKDWDEYWDLRNKLLGY